MEIENNTGENLTVFETSTNQQYRFGMPGSSIVEQEWRQCLVHISGIVLSLSQNKSIIEAARYGVACGTAATMNPGTELCRKEDADHLYKLLRLVNKSALENYMSVLK